MEYRIEGKKVRINSRYLEYIGRGKEGITYKYKGSVLKLYHDFPKKKTLSFRDCEYMTKIGSERILLPNTSVCDKKHQIRGYIISPFIDDEKVQDIYDMRGDAFLFERQAVQQELIYLGENYISVGDFCLDNFIYSDKFYLLDPGSYVVHWDKMNEVNKNDIINLVNYNLECFDDFLNVYIVLQYMRNYISNNSIYRELFIEIHQSYLASCCYNKMDYYSKFIIPDAPLKESIKQIVRCHKN